MSQFMLNQCSCATMTFLKHEVSSNGLSLSSAQLVFKWWVSLRNLHQKGPCREAGFELVSL